MSQQIIGNSSNDQPICEPSDNHPSALRLEQKGRSHISNDQKHQPKMPFQQLQQLYSQSLKQLNTKGTQKIKNWTTNRQQLAYLYFTSKLQYIQLVKNQKLQLLEDHNSELIKRDLLNAMNKRWEKVELDIVSGSLTVAKNKDNQKIQQQQQTAENHALTQQQLKAYQQQVRNKHKEIIHTQLKQKKRIQKLKLKQQQQKLAHQKKLQEQRQKQKEEIKKHHSELINKKISQNKQKRLQQQKFFLQRNKDYQFILKSSATNPALHEKMERNFRKRYESMFEQNRKKALSQRSRLLMSSRIEDLNIKDHEDKYIKWRLDNQAVRASKMQEQNRLAEMYQNQQKRYKKYKGRSNQKDNSDQESSNDEERHKEGPNYQQIKQQLHKIALEKRKKMQSYWENFVKQQKQPQIDPKKQQELQTLIEHMQKTRKMKKVKNEKGEHVYEELKLSDPSMKGLQYLQFSRELGRKRRSFKHKDTQQQSTAHEQNQKVNSKVDYLKQLRESRSSSLNMSVMAKNKLSFLEKKDLSFHEKLEKVEREAFKLEQMTKMSEDQLKYGKFKTSEEILQYKEEIDNNHLQILKMKLMLVTHGNH